MIIKFHQAHKTHRSILKTSWKNPANILGTSREHLENIKRTSIEYLEKIQKHLWSSENICEHLRTSEHILNTSENLYRISVINWGHPEKKCPHRGWLSIKVTTQLKTSENSWEHRKTSKIIWYHPENNWGPIIDNLVQFEEDFNSRTKKLRSGGVDWIGYLRPVQFLDHLTVIKPLDHHRLVDYQIVLNYHTIFPFKNTFGWDWIARKYPDFIAKLG